MLKGAPFECGTHHCFESGNKFPVSGCVVNFFKVAVLGLYVFFYLYNFKKYRIVFYHI